MRERTTWNRDQIKQAAQSKRADPYLMNQDHVNKQPPADKYVTGDPSTFAEDIHPSKDTWEAEYQNGQVKRNEIGQPEMRKDTFNHPEKTASKEVLLKKANLCIRVAQMMLAQGGRVASEQAVEDQSVALMHMPDAELIETFNRLAGDEEESKEAEGEQQQKQAEQQMQSQMQQAMDQCKAALAAGDQQGFQAAVQQMVQAQMQQAQMQQQGQGQQQAPVSQQQAPAVQAQGQQQAPTAQQVEQMVQAAIKRAMQQQAPTAQGQQQAPTAQGQQQQAPTAQGQQQMAQQEHVADDMLLDDMLMDDPGAGLAEVDIELEAPSMDVGDVGLGPEDEVLKTLFANDDEGGEQAQEQGQAQQKQAGMTRTASSRTVGTRPTGGVSRVGGGAAAGRGGDATQLSSLWATAPNVKDAF